MRFKVAIAVVLMSPVISFGSGLGKFADRIDNPIRGLSIPNPEPIRIGRGTLEPGTGSITRVLMAGNEPCGISIEGPAIFVLPIDDPFSAPLAIRNLDRASKLVPKQGNSGLEVRIPANSVVVWSWEATEPSDDAVETPGSKELPGWAAEVLNDPAFAPPSIELIAARRLKTSGVAYALIDSDKGIFLYATDPIDTRLEVLYHVEREKSSGSANRGRHFLESLVSQPLGRAWWERAPRPLVATHTDIEVINDSPNHFTIASRTDLVATRPNVGVWRSDLLDRVVSSTNKFLPNTVRSVKIDGAPADFLHRGGQLLVAIDPPMETGKTRRIEVFNEGNIAVRPSNGNAWLLGTWAWHPDAGMNGTMATSIISVKVPQDLVPFASGTTVSKVEGDNSTVLTTKLVQPMQFPVVAAGSYHVETDTRRGLTCNVGSYVFGKEKAAERLINLFFAAVDFYSRLFASPYPFEQADIIEVNDWGFGQAPAGVIFITQEAFDPKISAMNQYFSKGVNERYVHEIAHAWWGHVVKMDSAEEQWLSESFAEYSAALCIEALSGGGKKGRREFNEILKGWRKRAKEVGRGSSVYLANFISGDDTTDFLDRHYLLYDKGPLVIHGIRMKLVNTYGPDEGERKFISFMRAVLANFNFKWGSSRHLVGILNQLTAENWQPWFEKYLYGCEMPES